MFLFELRYYINLVVKHVWHTYVAFTARRVEAELKHLQVVLLLFRSNS